MKDQPSPADAFYDVDSGDLADLTALIDRTLASSDVPLADEVASNVPIYDMARHGASLADPAARRALLSEWAANFDTGSGVVVLRHAYGDLAPIDAATDVFNTLIAEEKAQSGGGADHFAAAGANDRLWNSAQKLCLRAPEVFARYFANPAIAAICEAWVGPGYQMTAQVNLVHPGGKAQTAHRDYHLGFQTPERAARYPRHLHALSAALTLQGAVAHCDMPLESGPTKLLPFSQSFGPGYLAIQREDVRALFEERHVQLPLAKGDALFFNPATFHAAGTNTSADIQRMANLMQISCPFGIALEALDRVAMCKALYPAMVALSGTFTSLEANAAIAACAEGYPFPTNLDTDPPVGGLAPESQSDLMVRSLADGLTPEAFNDALDARTAKRAP